MERFWEPEKQMREIIVEWPFGTVPIAAPTETA
jgi:hypothetical protein